MAQADLAYRYIKEKILNGDLKPAEKLIETQLAESIGVSRSTVKKALLKLEQENLVVIELNKGASVKSFTLEEIINYMEIQAVLEGLIIDSAVSNISEKELKKLGSILQQMKSYIEEQQFEEYSSCNKKFHDVIYSVAQNKQAIEMIKQIKTQLLRYRFRTVLVPGRSGNSYQEHQAIYQAFADRDSKKARAAVQEHIRKVQETIQLHYRYLI